MLNPKYNFLRWDYWFGEVDSRPLSVFRIVFALVLLKEAIYRLFITKLFLSDAGVFPRSVLFSLNRPAHFSLMDAFASPLLAQLFITLSAVVAVGLLLGYRTRWMVILNFILLLSIHERNPFILNGGDLIQRLLSFWMLFLPLADHYSLDALRRRRERYLAAQDVEKLRVEAAPQMAFAFPVRMIQLQVALVYLFTFLIKMTGETWRNGTAMFYSLQIQSLMLPSGDWFVEHMPLWTMTAGTHFTLFIEGGFILFVFLPIFQPYLRVFGLAAMSLLHIGIGILMAIPTFSITMMASYLTFFDAQWITPRDQTPTSILPPSAPDSPLWIILAMTTPQQITLAPAATEVTLDDVSRWQELAAHLPLSRYWAWLLKFDIVRRLIWWSALGYRPAYAQLETTPTPRLTRLRRTVSVLVLSVAMFFVIWVNLTSIRIDGKLPVAEMPRDAFIALNTTGLDQSWNLFAPQPSRVDGWMVVPGIFENGDIIDLFTGEALQPDMIRWYWGPYVRWRKFTSVARSNETVLRGWADYYCRIYNAERPRGERLMQMDFQYRYFVAYPPHSSRAPAQSRSLLQYTCAAFR